MSQLYNAGLEQIAKALTDLDGSDLRALLVKSTYTFSADHLTVDDGTSADPKSHELSGSGYARATLANKAVTRDDTNDRAVLDCDDPSFGSIVTGETIGGCVVFRHTGDDATAPLIAWIPFTATPTNGAPISMTVPAAGSGGLVYLNSPSS